MVGVRKKGLTRLEPVDPAERPLEMGVAGVRPVAQGIDDPDLDPLQHAKRVLVVELVAVGRVAERPEAEPPALAATMALAEITTSARPMRKGPSTSWGASSGPPEALLASIVLERVVEARADALEDTAMGEARDRLAHDVVERAQVVDAMDVVGVGVR